MRSSTRCRWMFTNVCQLKTVTQSGYMMSHEKHLEHPDNTQHCDLTHLAASGSAIRIRCGFLQYVADILYWMSGSERYQMDGVSPPTNSGLSIRIKLDFHLFATSIWFSPAVVGSILLLHDSHLILRAHQSSGANAESLTTHTRQGKKQNKTQFSLRL